MNSTRAAAISIFVRSVLVSVEGQTTVAYFHKRKPTEHAHVWSVTKSVISILVGIAADEGRLQVDQTLQELLPQQASAMTPQQASITLRQLLTMTSGISGDHVGLNRSADDTVSQILAYTMGNDPSVAFEYSNSSAHLVAAVLQNAVDQPVLDYARAKLFDPLGINTRPAWHGLDTGSPTSGFNKPGFSWAADRAGVNLGALGLKLTPADMIKLGELYVSDGRWHGKQVVSAAWVDESTSQQLTPAQEAQDQYGYLWGTGEYNEHAFFEARGSYYQRIICLPEVDVVVAVTAADDLRGGDTLNLTLDPLLEKGDLQPAPSITPLRIFCKGRREVGSRFGLIDFDDSHDDREVVGESVLIDRISHSAECMAGGLRMRTVARSALSGRRPGLYAIRGWGKRG